MHPQCWLTGTCSRKIMNGGDTGNESTVPVPPTLSDKGNQSNKSEEFGSTLYTLTPKRVSLNALSTMQKTAVDMDIL